MLVTLSEILRDANERHYAVGAFNCLSLENVMGAIDAAEALRSPIILQLAEVQFPCQKGVCACLCAFGPRAKYRDLRQSYSSGLYLRDV